MPAERKPARSRSAALSLREVVAWTLAALCAAAPISIAGINIAAGALTLLVLLADASGEDVRWDRGLGSFSYALIAYFLAAALVCATSIAPAVSFHQLNKDFHKLWIFWLVIAGAGLAEAGPALLAFGAALIGVSALGIGQALILREGETWTRAHGFIHPVSFGEVLAFGLLGGACLLVRPEEAEEVGASPRRLLAFFLIVGAAFVLNQTRGAFLGVAVGLACLGALDRTIRRWWAPLIVAGAVVVAFWEFVLPTHRSILQATENFGLNPQHNQQAVRLALWDVGWRIFKDHPWVGVGIGNYKTVFASYYSGTLENQRVWGSAHDLFIHQAAERGLVGLAALFAVLTAMVGRAWKRVRQRSSALNLWAFSASWAFIVMNLTEVAFQTEQVATVMLLIWALAEARHRPAA